ncbi:hypothetical protein NW768_000978 [Fusarium equiseti]|uniref:Uncharacterized protein n=1 Tax=Fusarium equiseti TaxID=61235 RepID=A0ABQ8RU10_FUSEQ|nr:hypothetical protein NW768_000978 [Fusarium equiseti]
MEDQAALRRAIEHPDALRPIIQELEPLLTELAQATAEYKAAKERYSHETDPLRERTLLVELTRCEGRGEDIETHATGLLHERLRRHIEDPGVLRSIIQELTPLLTEQLPRARAEYKAAKEQYSHEIDPSRESTLLMELPRLKSCWEVIEWQAIAVLQRKLRLSPSPEHESEQPGEDTTLATASTGPNDTSPRTKRTIRFDEVHRDGQRCWSRIIKREGYYYIFKCKEHYKIFDAKDPLKAAKSHLRMHSLNPNNKNAFKYLAYCVVDCNEARRMENETIVNRFLEEQKYKRQRDEASVYDIDGYPQPGKVYMVWWDNKNDEEGRYILQAILVLPFSDIKNSVLIYGIPPYYKSNEAGGYDWAEGYKDGQKHAKNRKYPVMCFDGKARHELNWLHVEEFRQLNLEDEHLEHRQEVQNYLASNSNANISLMNEINHQSEDVYDDSRNDDADDESDDLYDDSRNGDVEDDGERSETLDSA